MGSMGLYLSLSYRPHQLNVSSDERDDARLWEKECWGITNNAKVVYLITFVRLATLASHVFRRIVV
jgi:hypothetical protein